MRQTLKEYLITQINNKFFELENKQLERLKGEIEIGNLTIHRLYSSNKSWIASLLTVDKKAVPVPRNLALQVNELDKAYNEFQKEIDYLSNFLSTLLRSNVPLSTITAIIPSHVVIAFHESDWRNVLESAPVTDETLTVDYFTEGYSEMIHLLHKYIIYLLL